MIPVREPIERLARSLQRARSADETGAEVVRWLRALCTEAASLPVPERRDARRSYSRTLLHRAAGFEILLLHWDRASKSAIHDHGGAHCWFAVAAGTMGVDNFVRCDSGATPGYARVEFEGRELLAPQAIDFRQDDMHLHRCFTTEEPAVTLHVYAHPIDRFYTFDERAQTCASASSTYDAILTV